MNFFRTIDRTIVPFWAAGYCVHKGIQNVKKVLVNNSPITLLKIGAMQFSLAIVIGVVTKKIFDSFGWEHSEMRTFTIGTIVCLSSIVLGAIAAMRLGLTGSFEPGLMVPAITSLFATAALCLSMGIENIFYGGNHPSPHLILFSH